MSFDLAIWHSDRALSVEEAGELYVKLCEQEWIPIADSPAIEAFDQELCGAYPEIDTLPEDQVDDCPGNAEPRASFHEQQPKHKS